MHRTISELKLMKAEREERYGWLSTCYGDPDDEDVPLDLENLDHAT